MPKQRTAEEWAMTQCQKRKPPCNKDQTKFCFREAKQPCMAGECYKALASRILRAQGRKGCLPK